MTPEKKRAKNTQWKQEERIRDSKAGLKRLEFPKVPAVLHDKIKKLVHNFISNWSKNKLDNSDRS